MTMNPSTVCSFSKCLASVALLLCATGAAGAQSLSDLQPGRNFTSAANFGMNRSENIAPGDVDNDGDMDAIVANGGDFGNEQNRIFINLGGLQGGAIGTFNEQTAARFAGVAIDRSRDIEFVDFDDDGDFDVGVGNDGNSFQGGSPSRFYTNKGGLQRGEVGYYQEDTDLRWGNLVSIPLADQVVGGNHGPFRGFCCDCDFADLDDDGDNDLFYGTYGPAVNGTRDSLIFLNDGNGIFDEKYPWVDPAADIKTHTYDLDLVDLDGDFDIDIAMSSRNSQARTYMNNSVNGLGATLFNDITKAAFIDKGATGSATVNYEVEAADVDGDGDFDLWMNNYDGNTEKLLRNDGVAGGTYSFTEIQTWIKGDPNTDEEHVTFIDYDADGDLDAFLPNFGGTNYAYQSALAQGLDVNAVGLYHRTGLVSGLSPDPELPLTSNGGTTLDGDVADMDNDGDEDLLLSNDGNQQNFLFSNVLGVPDTHAPTIYRITQQLAKPNGTPTVLHVQVRDNSNFTLGLFYSATLFYAVNDAAPVSVPMFAQGSFQYRSVIPAQIDALITWHVEVSDLAGNFVVSAPQSFVQGDAPTPWTELGFGLAGVAGVPHLSGTGTLLGGQPLALDVADAAPSSTLLLFLSLSSSPVPFKGGQLAAFPWLAGFPVTLATGSAGTLSLPGVMPAGANGLGFQVHFQAAIADAAAPKGVALSNLLRGDVP